MHTQRALRRRGVSSLVYARGRTHVHRAYALLNTNAQYGGQEQNADLRKTCLLYTSDAADE